MAEILAVAGPKGGIGKTTLAVQLAVALAARGRRTLLVDLDAQSGVELYFGRRGVVGFADYLAERVTINGALRRTREDHLAVLLRGRLEAGDHRAYEDALARSAALPDLVDLLGERFDVILLDLPSGFGAVATRAAEIAHHVLAPVQAEPMATRALRRTLAWIESVRAAANPRLDLLGFVPTLIDPSAGPEPETLKALWLGCAGGIDVSVPRHPAILEAVRQRRPVAWLDRPPGDLVARFDALAGLVESRLGEAAGSTEDGAGRARQLLDRLGAESPDDGVGAFTSLRGGAHAQAVDDPVAAPAPQAGGGDSFLSRARDQILTRLCEQEGFGFRSWNELLEWCLRVAHADHAFVMDHHGLTIASHGSLQGDAVESTGTRLMIAFDHADKMELGDGRARQMSIQLGARWLHGVHVAVHGDVAFTFGLVSAGPLEVRVRQVLEDVVGLIVERFFEPADSGT